MSLFRQLPLGFSLMVLVLMLGGQSVCRGDETKSSIGATPQPTQAVAKEEEGTIEGKKGVSIPFEYQPPIQPFITIQISINKSQPLTFLVDTGMELPLCLQPWVVRQLKLRTTGEKTVLAPGNVPVEALEALQITLPTPSLATGMKMDVYQPWTADIPLLEQYSGSRIAGVIGGDLFLLTTSRFDFDKKTLTFFFNKHAPLNLPEPAVTLPLIRTERGVLSEVNVTLSEGVSSLYTVDTGATTTTIPATAAKKVKPLAKARTHSLNISGLSKTEKLLLPQLALGNHILSAVPVMVSTSFTTGNLGIDVLSQFRVTLDGRNNQMILEPRAHPETRLIGDMGISLSVENSVYYVTGIDNPSPLVKSIKVGDKLIAIEGLPTKAMKEDEAEFRFSNYEGTLAKLTFERADGTSYEVTLPRRTDFPSTVRSETGVRLLSDKKDGLRVIAVLPKSSAEQAGIEIGDYLIEIDGKPAQKMSLQEVISKLEVNGQDNKQIKVLVFRRKRDDKSIELKTTP